MTINEYFKLQYRSSRGAVIPQIECVDGFTMSVQASSFHYCSPRVDLGNAYTHVEVGFPSSETEALRPYSDDDSGVYGFVPVEVVDEIIRKHRGILV